VTAQRDTNAPVWWGEPDEDSIRLTVESGIIQFGTGRIACRPGEKSGGLGTRAGRWRTELCAGTPDFRIQNPGDLTVNRCVLPGQSDAPESGNPDQKPAGECIVHSVRETLPPAETFGTKRLVRVQETLWFVRWIRMRGTSAVRERLPVSQNRSHWHDYYGVTGKDGTSGPPACLRMTRGPPRMAICPVGYCWTSTNLAQGRTVVAGPEIIRVESEGGLSARAIADRRHITTPIDQPGGLVEWRPQIACL